MDLPQRGEDVVFLGQLVGLAVIKDKGIQAFEKLQQIRQRDVQPQIHRVGGNKFWPLHLVEHVVLQTGRDVGQQHEGRALVRFGQRGRERLEHAQLGQ